MSEIDPLNSDVNEDKDTVEKIAKHDELLTRTRDLTSKLLFIVFSFSFTYGLRGSIIVLFLKEFYDDTSICAVVVFASYISSGIMSQLFGYIGNRNVYFLDKLLMIAAAMDVITFTLEATTTTFIQIGIAYSIGGQPFTALYQTFANKLLPTFYVKLFQIQIVVGYKIGKTVSPLIGGII